MNKILLIILAVYLIGYIICLAITTPLIVWAVHENEREEGIYIERETPGLIGRAFLVALFLSMIWFLLFPLYVLMLAEKIAKRGEDD